MKKKLLKKFNAITDVEKKPLKVFLKKFDKLHVPDMEKYTVKADKKAWKKVACLDCGNCCKKMTPTFTKADVTRISAHLNMSESAFKTKWTKVDKDNGDVVNKTEPCQFLNLDDNKCSIYEVRPEDCALFPHFDKVPFDEYNHIFEQNLDYCPATFVFVKNLKKRIEKNYEF